MAVQGGDGPTPVVSEFHNDAALTGRYHSQMDKVLALAFPYDSAWHLRVNGEVIPLRQVNFGLAGALVPAGSARFELSYQPHGRAFGWRIAPFALVLSLLLVYVQRRWIRRLH